jgi:putative endonuclease
MLDDSRRARGAAAERLAAAYLESCGVKLLARNLCCRAGEIDLVALDGSVLAIVEVRQRSGAQFGGAPASVTVRKQRRVTRATSFFIARHPAWRSRAVRFDVLAIHGVPHGTFRIEWIKDAFRIR